MNYRVLCSCICLICAFFITAPVGAASLNIASAPILKVYVPNTPSNDEYFFEQTGTFLSQLSNQTLSSNVGDELLFFPLLASGYNIEDYDTAQQLINFLFYSAQVWDHYMQYQRNKGSLFTPINADDEYNIAEEYRVLAEKTFTSCKACQELYPDFVMYTLPEKEGITDDIRYTGRLGF